MGDLIMTGPALRALKESFSCRITVLTSSMGKPVTPFLPVIDEVMVADLPWIKTDLYDEQVLQQLVNEIRQRNFDGVIIFSVYSQSSLPAALLCLMAGIPHRLAFSRENPYSLLTHWVPDREPYHTIQHQVLRDLQLVGSIGATTDQEQLFLQVRNEDKRAVMLKLRNAGIDLARPFLIFHPGVSEAKRMYPSSYWIAAGKKVVAEKGSRILVTGTAGEQALTKGIARGIGIDAIDMAGQFSLGEFIALVEMAALAVSVNTGTVHIAAACQTPVVVLYANTNPQHTPWRVPCRVLPFSVPENSKSKNEIIVWVDKLLYRDFVPFPDASEVVTMVYELFDREPVNRHEHC
ncbi:MAG: glycosyltransferase family 9 protein [Pseudobacter sp.]|uniref:glycosyltransferase family 9 protein n=1 Tax=Pseudobacter sp. TaxID=2045420 RepID=UPI003F7E1223